MVSLSYYDLLQHLAFSHKILTWVCILNRGNILLSRKDSTTLQYILEQRKIQVKTFGLLVSIIDFTLSRINTGLHQSYLFFHNEAKLLMLLIWQNLSMSTGEDILFLDLSSDPEIFEGPKGDKQVRTVTVAYLVDFLY